MSFDVVANKKAGSPAALLLTGGLVFGSWLLYEGFAAGLIVAMYEGRSLGILNRLIRYQHKKPVEQTVL